MVAAAVAGDFRGVRYTETPAGDIESVNAVVAKFAVAPMPAPMPIVMHKIVNVRAFGSWALPEVVVKVRGDRNFFAAANGTTSAVVPAAGKTDRADRAFF
jgi:hypothetical protein